jgi:hypothetical protein
MDDEVLTGLAELVGVVHARVHERLLDTVPVDDNRRVVRVLLDDREQIAQQPPLGGGELGTGDSRVRPRVLDPVDRRPRRGDDRRRVAPGLGAARTIGVGNRRVRRLTATAGGRYGVATAGAGPARQALRRGFALFRYRCPSSYLFA